MAVQIYEVTGMTCEHCAKAVGDGLKAIEGVCDVAVELEPEGLSRVTVTSSAALATEAVIDALDGAGDYLLVAR